MSNEKDKRVGISARVDEAKENEEEEEHRASLSDMTSKFYRDLRQFMFANSVLSAAAGFSIGSAVKQLIEDLMDKIVLPLIRLTLQLVKERAYKYVYRSGHASEFFDRIHVVFDIGWSVLMFASIVILTFVVLEYLINKEVLGMRTRVRSGDQDDFAAARVKARVESILPTAQTAQQTYNADLADMLRGMAVLDREHVESQMRLTQHQKKKLRMLRNEIDIDDEEDAAELATDVDDDDDDDDGR